MVLVAVFVAAAAAAAASCETIQPRDVCVPTETNYERSKIRNHHRSSSWLYSAPSNVSSTYYFFP